MKWYPTHIVYQDFDISQLFYGILNCRIDFKVVLNVNGEDSNPNGGALLLDFDADILQFVLRRVVLA